MVYGNGVETIVVGIDLYLFLLSNMESISNIISSLSSSVYRRSFFASSSPYRSQSSFWGFWQLCAAFVRILKASSRQFSEVAFCDFTDLRALDMVLPIDEKHYFRYQMFQVRFKFGFSISQWWESNLKHSVNWNNLKHKSYKKLMVIF